MVLTVRVHHGAHPRRSVLGAAATLAAAGLGGTAALAGCSLPDLMPGGEPDVRPLPDAETLRAVRADALLMAARYDEAITLLPDLTNRLTPLRDAHREHAGALTRAVDAGAGAAPATPSTAGSGGPRERAAMLKSLAADERTAAERATAACLTVPSYRAPLVGMIAACRASHAEALA